LTAQEYISSLVENTTVRFYDGSCLTNPTAYITIQVNRDFNVDIPVVVYQGSSQIYGTKVGNLTYRFEVLTGINFSVLAKEGIGAYDTLSYIDNISSDKTIKFGLITVFYIKSYHTGLQYTDYIHTNVSSEVFGARILRSRFTIDHSSGSSYSAETLLPVDIESGDSSLLCEYTYNETSFPRYDLIFNNIATNDYDNLVGVNISIEGDNHIFYTENLNIGN